MISPSPSSWGGTTQASHHVVPLVWRSQPFAIADGQRALPYGLGRSYGDSCLNDGGTLLLTRGLDRFLAFDRDLGIVRCEAGVTLGDILALVVPHGWFVNVTPGTRHVTVGGAIANDVHGKNHHRVGAFGASVRRLELLRSDGTRMVCSPHEQADWFRATVGGLGLTGLITWADVTLRRVASAAFDVETLRFDSLDGFFSINQESEASFEYTVAWIDALATGRRLGRGLYLRANHAQAHSSAPLAFTPPRTVDIPVTMPSWVLNHAALRTANVIYYARRWRRVTRARVPADRFLYPLDAVGHWNRLYGRRGFFQYQCVVPSGGGAEVVRELLTTVARSQEGSFLTVLKRFGSHPPNGWLSFARPGFTLALDFPNRGARTLSLLNRLDAIVVAAGGAVYPAKDARMSGQTFRRSFPEWERLLPFLDPRFSSSFWRRVTGDQPDGRARAGA